MAEKPEEEVVLTPEEEEEDAGEGEEYTDEMRAELFGNTNDILFPEFQGKTPEEIAEMLGLTD